MNERPLWRLVAGRKIGPYPPEKLRPLMKDGRISPLDRFSYDGDDWRPPAEFPELLREPAPVGGAGDSAAAGNPLDFEGAESQLLPEPEPVAPGLARVADEAMDDAATKRLLAMIHGLIWVGVGVVVVLVLLMIVTNYMYSSDGGDSAASQPAAVPAAPAKPLATREEKKEEPLPTEPAAKALRVDEPSVDDRGNQSGTTSGTQTSTTTRVDLAPEPEPDIPATDVPRRRVPVLP
jgi:hypothetical protein